MTGDDMTLLELIRSDLVATTPTSKVVGLRFWVPVVGKLLINPQVRVTLMYRISHALALRGKMTLAFALRGRAIRNGGAEIHPLAKIGPGVYIVHSTGVAIGAYAIIGSNCRIYHGATVGAPSRYIDGKPGFTVVGDDVIIGTHAVVMNAVDIGDGAVIGANAVVTRDVGAMQIVGGIPARFIRMRTVDELG